MKGRGFEKRITGFRNRTQVAARIDAVQQEDGLIVKIFFTDADPPQLVTD